MEIPGETRCREPGSVRGGVGGGGGGDEENEEEEEEEKQCLDE